MKYRIYVVILCLVYHLIHTNGSYIPTGSGKNTCKENVDALEDVISALSNFYTVSSFNTTMYAPPKDFVRVDEQEYSNIRKYCTNFKTKFQNILDFKFQGSSVKSSTSHLATCPWVFVDNYDEDRLPKLIYEAKCVCSRCLHKTNGHKDVQLVPGLGRCKPVMTSVMTVRRQCRHNSDVYEYVAKAERISVGCTCTSPVFV
ncbi:uncharacterized protein LOC132715490 [Ruditapes philippinarum]|uniref:uncharacterized protein LOC132715490 n=1 Tax=Ruditapes philippinarum TaxID=129788 RepID=UPI00295BB4BC|nr:uncharacterized protein LOC132715490 [Ruditapes philippinarum]